MRRIVPFPIWDALMDLPPATENPVTVMAAGETVLTVGLRRGDELVAGPAIIVHSFAPRSEMSTLSAMAGHALIQFTGALPARTEEDLRSNMQELVALSCTQPQPVRLTIAGTNTKAGLYRIHRYPDGWVVCSLDPDVPLAVAGSQALLPAIDHADEHTWNALVNDVLDQLDLPGT